MDAKIIEIEHEHSKLFERIHLNSSAISCYLCKLPFSGLCDQVSQRALAHIYRKKEIYLSKRQKLIDLKTDICFHKKNLLNLIQNHLSIIDKITSNEIFEQELEQQQIIEQLSNTRQDFLLDKAYEQENNKQEQMITSLYSRERHVEQVYEQCKMKWISMSRQEPLHYHQEKSIMLLDSLFMDYAFSKWCVTNM